MLIQLTIENVIRWMLFHFNMGKHVQAIISDAESVLLDNYKEAKGLENSNSAIKQLIQSLDEPKPQEPKLNPRPDDNSIEQPEDSIDRTNYDKWLEDLNLKKL